MSRGWEKGSTRAWRRTRAAVLLRDRGLCTLKIQVVCTTTADCVHHTQGKAVTGDDPRYLTASCTPCNLKIGEPSTNTDPQPKQVTEW